MSEANEQEQKRPLTLTRPGGRLELRKSVETGQVRQSFSHGRSKTVTVEVRKTRKIEPRLLDPGHAEPAPTEAREPQPAVRTLEPVRRPVVAPHSLTTEEGARRVRALQDARKADEEARRRAEIVEADRRREEEERAAVEAKRRAEEETQRRAEEEAARRRAEEEAKRRSEEEEQRRKEEESRREVAERAGRAAAAKVAALAAAGKVAVVPEEEEEPTPAARRPGARPEPRRPTPAARRDDARRRGKMTVTRALSDDEERMRSLASVRRARERERQRLHQGGQEQQKILREVIVPETITVQIGRAHV